MVVEAPHAVVPYMERLTDHRYEASTVPVSGGQKTAKNQ